MNPYPYRKFLALFLIGLFLAFSVNAYACVVPVYDNIPLTQGSDCTMPGEEPVSQFCDGFKTLAVHSGHDNPSTGYAHVPLIAEAPSFLSDRIQARAFLFPPDTGQLVVQQDLLLLISVFRI